MSQRTPLNGTDDEAGRSRKSQENGGEFWRSVQAAAVRGDHAQPPMVGQGSDAYCAPATPISGVPIECWGAARRSPLLLQPPLHSAYRPVRCVLGHRRSPARGRFHLVDRVESEEALCPGADITGNA